MSSNVLFVSSSSLFSLPSYDSHGSSNRSNRRIKPRTRRRSNGNKMYYYQTTSSLSLSSTILMMMIVWSIGCCRDSDNNNHHHMVSSATSIGNGTMMIMMEQPDENDDHWLAATTTITTTAAASSTVNDQEVPPPQQLRTSTKSSSSYVPKHLHRKYCTYLDDKECQYYDEILGEARRNRQWERLNPDIPRPRGPVEEYYDAIASIPTKVTASSSSWEKPNLPAPSSSSYSHHHDATTMTTNVTTMTTLSSIHQIIRRHQQQYGNVSTEQQQPQQDDEHPQVQYHRDRLREKLRTYTKPRRLAPSVGTNIRVLVLLIKFKGHENRPVPNRTYFDTLFNGDGVSATNPVGSVKEWLRYSSLGKYRVVFDVRDWQVTSNTESFFAGGTSGFNGPSTQQNIAVPILTTLDSTNSVNWLNGYIDSFGYLNQLVILHSGYGAEMGTLSCSKIVSEQDPKNRIWSQGSSQIGTNGWTSKDFYQLNSYAMTSAFGNVYCQNNVLVGATGAATMGQVTHEYNHGFGLLDLYDQDYTNPVSLNHFGGISKMGIMANSFGWQYRGSINGHHDPWSRIDNGWVTPIVITQDGDYAIMPSEISGQIYKIQGNYPVNEYLLIENRQPIKWDKDMNALTNTGIMIYHVDDSANGQTKRGYPGSSNWPSDHYMVSILQADGRYDIEKGVNDGDATDFWIKGNSLGPSPTTSPTSAGVWPNTNSIQFGKNVVTGLNITITSDSNFIMTFRISGLPKVRSANVTTKTGDYDPRSTQTTASWIFKMLFGTATLLALMMLFIAL